MVRALPLMLPVRPTCMSMQHNGYLLYADDSSSVQGCDKCFSGLTLAAEPSLKYVTVDDSTTFESFGNQIANQLSACGSGLANAVISDIGQLRAYPLLAFQNNCNFNFQEYGQTAQVVINYYTAQGIDLIGILTSNSGSSNANTN